MSSILNTHDLAVGYRGRAVVTGINLELGRGEIMTVIGPNGMGKSTLLKTVGGLIPPVSGSLALDGRPLASLSELDRARRMAVLLPGRVDTEWLTARQMVEAGRYPFTGLLGILGEEDREAVARVMEITAVADLADRYFNELSDGQKQRVLLARAMAQEPALLILDEPASFLDIRFRLELVGILKRLVAETGVSVLASLHELRLAMQLADGAVCLKDGRVDRQGTAEEVFEEAYLTGLYDLPPGGLLSV